MPQSVLLWSLSRLSLAAGIVALGTAVALAVRAAGSPNTSPVAPPAAVGFKDVALSEPAPPLSMPPPPVQPAPPQRLRIPAAGVDAPVVEKGLRSDLVMEAPDGPWEVAWYAFTARPGEIGNAVFSGHVDFVDVGPAVFWELGLLTPGDLVEVELVDGRTLRYRVVAMAVYDEATAPVPDIIGPTARETVTLITCAGNFNRRTGRYDQRLVVRAERVPDGT